MSLLSNTQGSPEREWSVLAGLAVFGDQPRDELEAVLNPGSLKPDVATLVNIANVRQVISAASSLGAVGGDRSSTSTDVDLPALSDEVAISDWVHDKLCALGPESKDAVILEAYAWFSARSGQTGSTSWVYELSPDAFADAAAAGLVGEDDDGGKRMNREKVVAWRRWLIFLGLAVSMPSPWPPQPVPTARIAREIARSNVSGSEVAAGDFLNLLARRMPYLDRGHLYLQACNRLGWKPDPRQLSPVLSTALRELHDEGVMQLKQSGDSPDVVALSVDQPHLLGGFDTIFFPKMVSG